MGGGKCDFRKFQVHHLHSEDIVPKTATTAQAVRILVFHDFRPLSHFTVLTLKHRGLGWECAGRFASRFFSSHSPAFNCCQHSPTVLSEVVVHNFGLLTLDRFPLFSVIAWKRPSIGFQVMPKTAEIDQTWPWSPAHWHKKYNEAITYPHQSQPPLTKCV